MHLSVSGAIASVGINVAMMISFSLLAWWTMGEVDDDFDAPTHAPMDVSSFPLPDFLRNAGYERTINIGIFGKTGCGKSSLVNALRRRKASDADAAPVGVEETTTEPVAYHLVEPDQKTITAKGEQKDNSRQVRIWDLPGAGTSRFPAGDCVKKMGLRYFDVVVLVIHGRVSETDLHVAEELDMFKVPHFIVRSQVDVDIQNEADDYGREPAEAEKIMRGEMSDQGFSNVFLVSSRIPDQYDFRQLVSNIVASVQAKRRIHQEDACPICFELFDEDRKACGCHWCRNSVCNQCAAQLQGKLDETPCPFCRRWTSLLSNSY
mmetsp:Transcript_18593/g.30166  ORF Transcript_18593/g.30166 Transcript_18593/m.30166 type:complete len:320 (+) Transcript_18593:1-960(+)